VAEKNRKFPLRKRILLISFMLIVGIIAFPTAESGYYFIKGLIALRGGFEGESVMHLEKSIKANPNFAEAYMLLDRIHELDSRNPA
jgi:ferritin-like protein